MIADVLTPLLGLDTMIQNSLSLSIGHGSCHFLVNTAGERTQLEHMGKHLYMIACPSQHGLSHCFKGSLSQLIGFPPSDKELHEPSLASNSSSSPDLDEDRSQHPRNTDSLDFPCQAVRPAALAAHDVSSFELQSGMEVVADTGGKLPAQSFYPQL